MKNFALIMSSLVFVWSSLHAQVTPVIEWEKCFGGSNAEWYPSIQQTADSGYIIAGNTESNDNDVSGWHVGYDTGFYNYQIYPQPDFWVVKLDVNGNLIWQKCLGGSGYDAATSVKQTTDGGFIVLGLTESNDGDVFGNHLDGWSEPSQDYWVVRLDSGGNLIWQKCLGGSNSENASCIQQSTDGGFIVCGYSCSYDGDVSGNHGGCDFWIVKLDSMGNLIWQKSLGGSGAEWPFSIQQTYDGWYIVSGYTESTDGDVTDPHGDKDFWVVKLDSAGNLIWQKSLGGLGSDIAYSIQQSADGEFILAGATSSDDGDVTGYHVCINGGYPCYDYWVVKLDTNGNLVWQKCLGGSKSDAGNFDFATSVQQTTDGGFVVGGGAISNDGDVSGNHSTATDYWVVKLNANGDLVWQKCVGGNGYEYIVTESIQQTFDEGYILAAMPTQYMTGDVSAGHGNYDFWIVKLSPDTAIATGLSGTLNHPVSIYPNPVKSQLYLNLGETSGDAIIRVSDIHGTIILLPVSFLDMSAEINTSSLPTGIYTLQIINLKRGESHVEKFAKQ